MAAGHGTAEARDDGRAGAGQSRRRVPADGAGGPRRVPPVAHRERARNVRQSRSDRGAAPSRRLWRARRLRRQHERPPVAHHPHGRRGARAADRLRERREPAALARDDAAEGAVGAPVARRDACPTGASAADREPAARVARRRARHPRRLLGTAAPAGPAGRDDSPRLAHAGVRRGHYRPHRRAVRHRAGAARHGHERQLGAQGDRAERRRIAQRSQQVAARRPGGDLAGAAGRRGAVPPHAAQPAAGRRRIQSGEPAAVPCQSLR